MGKWLIALLAASAGVVAAAASAHVVVATTAYATQRLHGHGTTDLGVSCRRGFAAVSGGVARPARDARLLSVQPVDARSFAFRFANPGLAARVTVAVACRRSSANGPELRQTRVERRLLVPAGGFVSASLSCPPRTTPAGSGVDLRGQNVTLRRAIANLRGFAFTVRNGTEKPTRVAVYGNCLTAVRGAGAAAEALRVEITSFTDPSRRDRDRYGMPAVRAGSRSAPATRSDGRLSTSRARLPSARPDAGGSRTHRAGTPRSCCSSSAGARLPLVRSA
jgi:hypothetical protein